ncbi:hypothetical protein [Kitasatospora nipponensis]|uniref:hypothetical protein n=1 Tax=Kitasatospora nipponensis TaxID=258049 RepID=UPI0031E23B30
MTDHGTGDDLWQDFVREYEKNNAVHEPSAAERTRPPRRRRTRLAILVGCCVLALGAGLAAYRLQPDHPIRDLAAAATAAPSPTPAVSPPSTAPRAATVGPAPSADGSPTAPAATAAPSTARLTTAIPPTVFPAQVAGYTRVASVANPSCTGSDTVAAPLAGMITQGHGCLGVTLALYKDADNNEYDMAVFTLRDPLDAFDLATTLGANPQDYEVAVQIPPQGSGLRELPADSGLVQSFGSNGQALVVAMAQWADGHSSDYQSLEDRLSPLAGAITKQVPR